MKMWRVLTLAIVVVGLAAPDLAGFTNWLRAPLRTTVFALAPPAAVALALVVYFNWREKLRSRIVAPEGRDDELMSAA